jgi:5-methylcytosine-specific restriction endonuclease McrA
MECHRNRVAADYAKNPEPTKRNAIKRMREMRRDDPERAKAIGRNAMRAWRGENRDRHLANDRAWREANRETINAQRRERYDSDPDKFRAKVKRWRKRYPEKARDRFRVWCKANPDKTRVRHRNRRARKRNAEGRHAAEDIARIRVAQNDLCVFCEIELHGKGHVDHKIPLARGGSNWPSNLQILCGSCNLSKGAKLPDEMVFPMPGV